MKILYNTESSKFEWRPYVGEFNQIYNSALSKTPGWLPEYVLELDIVDDGPPEYDPVTQRVSSTQVIDVENLEYRTEYTVIDKEEHEIFQEYNPTENYRLVEPDEEIPYREDVLILGGSQTQVRYNFGTGSLDEVVSGSLENDDVFTYEYINMATPIDKDNLISSIIRKKYSQDRAEYILRRRMAGHESLEYLKFNNYAQYAMAIGNNEDPIDYINRTVYEVILPLDQCVGNGDYAGMAFEVIVKHITFEADPIANTGKAYPGWIDEAVIPVLEGDPRVSISTVNLWDD